eukprot:89240-Prorocentrum_minimum.AAC.1
MCSREKPRWKRRRRCAPQGSTRTCVARKRMGGEMNSSVVKWLVKGLMDSSRLWRFLTYHEPALPPHLHRKTK